jgi:hypothetical protein
MVTLNCSGFVISTDPSLRGPRYGPQKKAEVLVLDEKTNIQ